MKGMSLHPLLILHPVSHTAASSYEELESVILTDPVSHQN